MLPNRDFIGLHFGVIADQQGQSGVACHARRVISALPAAVPGVEGRNSCPARSFNKVWPVTPDGSIKGGPNAGGAENVTVSTASATSAGRSGIGSSSTS